MSFVALAFASALALAYALALVVVLAPSITWLIQWFFIWKVWKHIGGFKYIDWNVFPAIRQPSSSRRWVWFVPCLPEERAYTFTSDARNSCFCWLFRFFCMFFAFLSKILQKNQARKSMICVRHMWVCRPFPPGDTEKNKWLQVIKMTASH